MPATGRYAVQGAQVRAGLELWASRAGAHDLLGAWALRARVGRATRLTTSAAPTLGYSALHEANVPLLSAALSSFRPPRVSRRRR